MVHNLNDRELWVKQGEEYLRKARSNPPVHPLITAAQASRGAEGGKAVHKAGGVNRRRRSWGSGRSL
jgi:hypothetical protein